MNVHHGKTGKDILIVEDNIDAAETFKALLEVLGHRAEYSLDGGSAVALIGQKTFDLIFMDINLPDINGIELLKTVKSNLAGEVLNTKFVAVSGHSAADPAGVKASEQFDFYLEKPINLAMLDKILTSF
jgi:CheY-like chemotaxis protein